MQVSMTIAMLDIIIIIIIYINDFSPQHYLFCDDSINCLDARSKEKLRPLWSNPKSALILLIAADAWF